MAKCFNMWKNGWTKDEIPLEVQRWDKCCHNGKVKAQAWPQSMTMMTHQWPQVPKLQHTTCKNQRKNTKNLQAQKLKMGMIKIDLQVVTFKKYELEL